MVKRAPAAATEQPSRPLRSRFISWVSRASSARSALADGSQAFFQHLGQRTFFEGASESPRLIQVPDTGPNSANLEIEKLRAKSRWLYANDPFWRQANRQVANNCVHYGIKPNLKDKALRKIWKRFVRESDARGQTSFYGQQWLATLAASRDGETFFRIRRRRPGEMKSGINFQLQSLEADHVPLAESKPLPGGNVVVSGVELDAIERVAAYWMYEYHPKDWMARGIDTGMPVRVPADQVLHVYMPDRFSDTRGYPWGASAMTTSERYRTYDDAELERKIVAASKGGYFKKPRMAGDEENMFADDGAPDFRAMAAGEYVQIPEGWDIQETLPAATDANYAPYRRENLSGLAVAFGFPVELVTMNWEKLASDRQYRGMMMELVRHFESIQDYMLVFRFSQRVLEMVISEAYVNGLWKPEQGKTVEDYFDVEWIAPKRGYIHPVQDVNAVATAIEKGLESRKRAVASNGEDVEDIDEENLEDVQRAERMGIRYKMFGLDTPAIEKAVPVAAGEALVDTETGEEIVAADATAAIEPA